MTEPEGRAELDRLVAAVTGGSWADRVQAVAALRWKMELVRTLGLTEAQCVALVRAAGEPWPASRSEYDDPRGALLLCACQSPHPACLPQLLTLYPTLTGADQVQWQALMLLSLLPQREAAERWVEWYRVRYRAGRGVPPPLGVWPERGLHADLVLPALMEFSDTSWMEVDGDWLATAFLGHIQQYLHARAAGREVARWLIAAAKDALAALPAAGGRPGSVARWTEPFRRYKTALLVSLLVGVPKQQALPLVRAALRHQDPRVACAGIAAAMQLSLAVPAQILEMVAADPETRRELYDSLRALKRAASFPRRWRTQAAMAEADLIQWLIADIDRAPDEVRLLQRIDRREGRYYVFAYRFLEDASESEWKAGVSGVWPTGGKSMLDRRGPGTFSRFEPADAHEPAVHLRRVLAPPGP